MKILERSTAHMLGGALLAIVGIAAAFGGIYAITGARGVPTEWLAGSPFSDYVVPGIVLLSIVGGSLLVAAAAVLARTRWRRVALLAAGAVMLTWIGTQVVIIGPRSWL